MIPTYAKAGNIDGKDVIVKWDENEEEFVEIARSRKDFTREIVDALNYSFTTKY